MPPKKATNASKRGRPSKPTTGSGAKRASSSKRVEEVDPFASSANEEDESVSVLDSDEETPKRRRSEGGSSRQAAGRARAAALDSDEDMDFEVTGNASMVRTGSAAGIGAADDEDEEPPEKTIPSGLLARLLHEMFEKDGTRMTGDAARAASKYVDVFVREAIARCVVERDSSFLEASLFLPEVHRRLTARITGGGFGEDLAPAAHGFLRACAY